MNCDNINNNNNNNNNNTNMKIKVNTIKRGALPADEYYSKRMIIALD
jgi:hypothetical protein